MNKLLNMFKHSKKAVSGIVVVAVAVAFCATAITLGMMYMDRPVYQDNNQQNNNNNNNNNNYTADECAGKYLWSNFLIRLKNESGIYQTGSPAFYVLSVSKTISMGTFDFESAKSNSQYLKNTVNITTGSTGGTACTYTQWKTWSNGGANNVIVYVNLSGFEPKTYVIEPSCDYLQSWNGEAELVLSSSGTLMVDDTTITVSADATNSSYTGTFKVGGVNEMALGCDKFVVRFNDTNATDIVTNVWLTIPGYGMIQGQKKDPTDADMFYWELNGLPTGTWTLTGSTAPQTSTNFDGTLEFFDKRDSGCVLIPNQIGTKWTTETITFTD